MIRKVINDDFTMVFQVESVGVSYSQHPEDSAFESIIYDSILVKAKAILSEYKNIKVGDTIDFRFYIQPYLMNEKCKPSAFGSFSKNYKKLECTVYVAPPFPQRLEFMLNQGIKPYFDLSCYREKYQKPVVKSFSMESEVKLEDYERI